MKNLVICCDWINSERGDSISNVLKFYHCLRKKDNETVQQLVYYDPGVGTPGPAATSWHRLKDNINSVVRIATGYGFDNNILSAYDFLIRNYQDGDHIYLFGFSCEAYSVRVLAGLIHAVGLLSPEQANFTSSRLAAYKQSSDFAQLNSSHSANLQNKVATETVGYDNLVYLTTFWATRWPTIRLVGVLDTIANAVTPRSDRFLYTPSLEELVFTRNNPSVQAFRQAISIDERRCMIRLKPWDDSQDFVRDRFAQVRKTEPQDSLQVWFAGVHADIGGGYPEAESALSKYPLLWLIEEAAKCGLKFDQQIVNQLAWGMPTQGKPFKHMAPDFAGVQHDSMTGTWRVLEYLPKSAKYKEWPERKSILGFYVPDCEPRVIPEGAIVHESVVKRMSGLSSYRPINMPQTYGTFPLSVPPR
ncbi:DUF2235 domain-containing protein [Bradyrhizobium sp. 24]|uniref:DUF2235 domain-containing protein n=1 Tax=unclassified Bradyrhizobium TaxID=2631580 RepID=UPI001FF76928|nr:MULTISPECIES: DUF2235 domain-containing protein [unclassified Bradyrhizobium]MCK1297605.1 DUF2235 domain-containing protein [Bradyrhizobium sp. 37]MCK1381239.1 DUF2235 domain-containing protein [Bradyrhizobium sp. 24]MCK1771009.1 DUF2235 domain-containing protein [Bradyrhizobium sp. 134]